MWRGTARRWKRVSVSSNEAKPGHKRDKSGQVGAYFESRRRIRATKVAIKLMQQTRSFSPKRNLSVRLTGASDVLNESTSNALSMSSTGRSTGRFSLTVFMVLTRF